MAIEATFPQCGIYFIAGEVCIQAVVSLEGSYWRHLTAEM